MTELLLKHLEVSVARSGALHLAAELGALDTMRVLMQHGADVDEILPEEICRDITTPYGLYGRQCISRLLRGKSKP